MIGLRFKVDSALFVKESFEVNKLSKRKCHALRAASCDRTSLYFPFSKSQYIRIMVWYSQEEDGLDPQSGCVISFSMRGDQLANWSQAGQEGELFEGCQRRGVWWPKMKKRRWGKGEGKKKKGRGRHNCLVKGK